MLPLLGTAFPLRIGAWNDVRPGIHEVGLLVEEVRPARRVATFVAAVHRASLSGQPGAPSGPATMVRLPRRSSSPWTRATFCASSAARRAFGPTQPSSSVSWNSAIQRSEVLGRERSLGVHLCVRPEWIAAVAGLSEQGPAPECGELREVVGPVDLADALGLEPGVTESAVRIGSEDPVPYSIEAVHGALRGVYDPEIPVNIVDLGLVYRCEERTLDDGRRRIEIDMTMTAPGCGMGDVIQAHAARAVQAVPGVDEVEMQLVWDPPWSRHRMPEAIRLELGLL